MKLTVVTKCVSENTLKTELLGNAHVIASKNEHS